jgi:hypothetical protein
MFPSGGDKLGPYSHFRSGFSWLVEKLHNQDMIYSFYITPQHVEPLVGKKVNRLSRFTGFALDLLFESKLNLNHYTKKLSILVKENYSMAEEWKWTLCGVSGNQRNYMATSHYLDKFNQTGVDTAYSILATKEEILP